MEHLQEINLLSGLAICRVKEMEGRIKELEAELKALKPRCLYEGYANARDYLEDVLKLREFWEWEKTFCPKKDQYNSTVTVRKHLPGSLPAVFVELREPIPPRADGRKIATASLERTYGCPINNWFKMDETPFLRNCPLYEGDVFLEELRAKHTDEELEDLFYSFQGWEKKTWSETQPTPLQIAEAKLADAEQRAEKAEANVKRMKEKPEIRGQSAMQMVIAISMIARSCPEADFKEIHDLWVAHADEDNAEQKQKDHADAGGAGLSSYLASWLSSGAPQSKCLCACLEPDCPTFEKVYKKGRGFVNRWDLEEDCDCCDGYSPGFVSGDEPCDKCLRRQEEQESAKPKS